MNERAILRAYNKIKDHDEYTQYSNQISEIKSIITPKKNIDLKELLVNASEKSGVFKMHALKLLEKKIEEIKMNESQKNKEMDMQLREHLTKSKISKSRSFRPNSLSRKRSHYIDTYSPLSPITEGELESSPRSPSAKRGGTRKRGKRGKTYSKVH